MIKSIALFLLFAAAPFAAPQQQDPPAAPATKKTKKTAAKKTPPAAPEPLAIPKDAVLNANGTYSYTDKNGKKWIYGKTPFGLSRQEDMGNAGSASPDRSQYVRATDNGDTVKFVQQTPFGPSAWEKKKSDLTDEERRIFENQQPKPAQAVTKPE